MRTIVHLSDLHFGRIDPLLPEPLVESVEAARPDLVAVSGDLTQRARPEQFEQARAFLDALPSPQIVVPGNHDVPLYNAYLRFFGGLRRFRRYISEDLDPIYADEEMAVIGLNSARPLAFKGGRFSLRQVERAREWLCGFPPRVTKIIVAHHPFDLPPGHGGRVVGRAQMAMRRFADCGADLFLSGHLHLGHTGDTSIQYQIQGRSALIVQAGTATSTRGRGEANSFNVIRIEAPEIEVERLSWDPLRRRFLRTSLERRRRP
jgi:3',5'-cyclic AMP phosphodiesterase CpdA